MMSTGSKLLCGEELSCPAAEAPGRGGWAGRGGGVDSGTAPILVPPRATLCYRCPAQRRPRRFLPVAILGLGNSGVDWRGRLSPGTSARRGAVGVEKPRPDGVARAR